ncbi:MAG TPA: prenyltransferase/squalene oxidase repeat-containing protein [Planctomycetota bacterium]|nr:prenyltransferase/squalene oxidase repeat-containing protein [Planctomycetota bacterium]
MLQVARLAPNLLQAAADRVADFLHGRFNPDGGVADRAGRSDLYYTVFGLEGLLALRRDLPVDPVRRFLAGFGDGPDLDLVHLTCLARAWAALPKGALDASLASLLKRRIDRFRAGDGGFAAEPGAPHGTVYHAFLALGALQDAGASLDDPQALLRSVLSLRAEDGSFANRPGLRSGTTPTTAGAVALLRALEAPVPPGAADWLLDRARAEGGFLPVPQAPMPDLLSTATALHALSILKAPIGFLKEPTLDFIDTLWTGQAFCGSWADDIQDAEYTYYGLLALGHLSLA